MPGDHLSNNKPFSINLKNRIRSFAIRIKELQGDPHYIAKGMAIGVFVGITPTIPFHTLIALGLSFIFRGSKAAAVIGVWAGNPLTMPFFYLASYKAGLFLLGNLSPFVEKPQSILTLMDLGVDDAFAMIIGGIIIGIIPGIVTYFITRNAFIKLRSRKQKKAIPTP